VPSEFCKEEWWYMMDKEMKERIFAHKKLIGASFGGLYSKWSMKRHLRFYLEKKEKLTSGKGLRCIRDSDMIWEYLFNYLNEKIPLIDLKIKVE